MFENKKGFTLMEVLVIIVIIAIISVIVIPTVKNSIDSAREATYEAQVNTITTASDNYFMHTNKDISEPAVIYLEDILNSGYINKEELINPITEKEMTGCVLVTLSSNQYKYKYLNSLDECLKYPNLNA